jgi:hypothetical protein
VFNTVKPEPVSFTLVLENNPTLLTKRGKKKTIILCFSHVTAKITDPISKNPAKPNSQAHLLAFSSPSTPNPINLSQLYDTEAKKMSTFLHQRPLYSPLSDPDPLSPRQSSSSQRQISLFSRTGLIALLSLLLILGVILPWTGTPSIFSATKPASLTKWQQYTLSQAVSFVAKNKTVIVCAVSQPYLPFLSNWLISISRQKHQDKVLVIAEDYATLYKVNEKWPGHAVLVPPAPDSQTAHKFGSQVLATFNSLMRLSSINSYFLCRRC